MLEKPEGRKCFDAKCDACGKTEYTDEETHTDARDVMKQAGWLDFPVKGVPEERWKWRCKDCRPKAPETLGRTTPPIDGTK